MIKIERELMQDLLEMAQTSRPYKDGQQWAVDAVLMAKAILKE